MVGFFLVVAFLFFISNVTTKVTSPVGCGICRLLLRPLTPSSNPL